MLQASLWVLVFKLVDSVCPRYKERLLLLAMFLCVR